MKRLFSAFLLFGLLVMCSCGETTEQDRLANAIHNINSDCPIKEDVAVTLKTVEDRGSEIDYFYDVDESKIDMNFVKDNLGDFWSQKKDDMMYNPLTMEIVPLAIDNNKEIGFKYKGTDSGEVAEFKFTVDELRSMLPE